jgi:hypothetical protein
MRNTYSCSASLGDLTFNTFINKDDRRVSQAMRNIPLIDLMVTWVTCEVPKIIISIDEYPQSIGMQ